LLIYLSQALLSEGEPTPFQTAVREFLSYHSLDPHHVASVWEELVRFCVENPKGGKAALEWDSCSQQTFKDWGHLLKHWRDQTVHGSLKSGALEFDQSEAEPGQNATDIEKRGTVGDRGDQRIQHVRKIRGKYAYLNVSSDDLHRERRTDESTGERQLRGVEP